MKHLLLLLFATLPVWSQAPTITQLTCQHTDRSLIVRGISSVTSGDAVRLKYDYDDVSLDRQSRQLNSGGANGGRRQAQIYDLEPGQKVYFDFQASDATKTSFSTQSCPTTCTNCGSSDYSVFADNSGCNCDSGTFPSITTDAEDADPAPDPPVTSAATTPPAITGGGGHTYTVASGCADFDTELASAITDADSGDTVELVLPSGEQCAVGPLLLPEITNGGMVVVRCSADPKLLPPPGAMIDETYRAHACGITYASMADLGLDLIDFEDNGRGWYFENVRLGGPDLDSSILAPVTMTITGINTSTDTITLDDISALPTGNEGQMVWVNLEGTGVRGGYGPMQACNVTSTTPPAGTLQLRVGMLVRGNCTNQGTLVNLVGTYGSGGTVKRFITLPIAAHTSSNGNHALTITGHGLANFPSMTITGGTSNTITVTGTPSEYQLGNTSEGNATASTVHVEGTSGGNCDGLWRVSVSGSVLTLSRTGATPDCAGVSSGTVHGHRAYSVFRTSSDTIGDSEPRSLNLEVVDANTLEILETAAVGGVTGGYLFQDIEAMGAVANMGNNAGGNSSLLSASIEDVTFDRSIIDQCLPWHNGFGFAISSTENVAIVNSWFRGCSWRRRNPVSGLSERIHGLFQAYNAISGNGSVGLVHDNNYIWPSPFLFTDTDDSAQTPQDARTDDYTVTRNYMWGPDWTFPGHASFRYHYFHRFYVIELKSQGERTEIFGNYFKGWGSAAVPSEAAILFSYLGSSNGTFACNGASHVRADSNIFDRGNTAIAFVYQDSSRSHRMICAASKFSVQNNLIVNTDTPTYGQFGGVTGEMLGWSIALRDMVVANNTFAPKRCVSCAFLSLGDLHSNGVRVTDNIFVGSEGSNSNRQGVRTEVGGNEIPSEWISTTAGLNLFTALVWRGTATDIGSLSEWESNVHVPGIQISSSGTYSVKAASLQNSDTICKDEFNGIAKYAGLGTGGTNVIVGASGACSGNNVDSLNDRLALAFNSLAWSPTVTYSGKGADLQTIADAMGVPGPVTVDADDNETTFAFHGPTTTGCYVDVAPFDTDWSATWDNAATIIRSQDISTSQTQSITVGGLTPETVYYYRGFCRKVFIGRFVTGGTP